MLTRDKGWIKPLLVIALVAWIPVFGQIVVLGYGLEWARLTAWGVDSAPKQRKVDYKKMLTTGLDAFLVSLFMGLVIVAIGYLACGSVYAVCSVCSGATNIFASGEFGGGLGTLVEDVVEGMLSPSLAIILYVVNLLLETFILAAAMRTTIYDSFTSGWRVDRLFQMVVRDFGGFVHVCGISALGGLIIGVCDELISLAARRILISGLMRMSMGLSLSTLLGVIVQVGIVPALCVLLLVVLLLYAVEVLDVALQLVTINAMGQWFQRFDVGRWGVSGDPLPEGVPHVDKGGSAPERPEGADEDAGQQYEQQQPQYQQPSQSQYEQHAQSTQPAGNAQAASGAARSADAARSDGNARPADNVRADGNARPASSRVYTDEGEAAPAEEHRNGPIMLGPVQGEGSAEGAAASAAGTASATTSASPETAANTAPNE